MTEARAYETGGDYRSANASLREAVKTAEQSGDLSSRYLPPALNALGLNYEALGLYADAVPVYERALSVLETAKGRQCADYAALLGNFAAVLIELQQNVRAESLLREAIGIQLQAGPGHEVPLAILRSTLAQSLMRRGRLPEAGALFEQDLAVFERHRDARSIELGMALNNMAVVRMNQGRRADALELIERGLAEMEKTAGPDHPFLIEPLNNLATVCGYLNRNDEAERNFRRALAIAEARHLTSSGVYGRVLVNYAELLRRTGHKREGNALKSRAGSVLTENARMNGIGMTVSALSFAPRGR